MAWVCVERSGKEIICEYKPYRFENLCWEMSAINNNCVGLSKGSIKKLIGRDLNWSDEPVELKKGNV